MTWNSADIGREILNRHIICRFSGPFFSSPNFCTKWSHLTTSQFDNLVPSSLWKNGTWWRRTLSASIALGSIFFHLVEYLKSWETARFIISNNNKKPPVSSLSFLKNRCMFPKEWKTFLRVLLGKCAWKFKGAGVSKRRLMQYIVSACFKEKMIFETE